MAKKYGFKESMCIEKILNKDLYYPLPLATIIVSYFSASTEDIMFAYADFLLKRSKFAREISEEDYKQISIFASKRLRMKEIVNDIEKIFGRGEIKQIHCSDCRCKCNKKEDRVVEIIKTEYVPEKKKLTRSDKQVIEMMDKIAKNFKKKKYNFILYQKDAYQAIQRLTICLRKWNIPFSTNHFHQYISINLNK